MTAIPSVLVPKPQPLWIPLAAAFSMHVAVAGSFVLMSLVPACHAHRVPIDPTKTIEVSFMEVKHADKMPTKATVAPRPQGQPEPAAKPAPPPPPVQSDLTFKDPKATVTQGSDTAPRDDAIKKALREAAMQEALAGAVDREATDPNSTATESHSSSGTGMPADPELMRYKEKVERLFRDQFRPNPAVVAANPKLVAVYDVYFDHETGKVSRYKPRTKSGNASYDASVEFAIQAVSTVPLPPERFRDLVPFFTIEFPPP